MSANRPEDAGPGPPQADPDPIVPAAPKKTGRFSFTSDQLDQIKVFLTALSAIVLALANLVGIAAKQWLLLVITFAGAAIAAAILIVSNRLHMGNRWTKPIAVAFLFGAPFGAIGLFFAYCLLPRVVETGTTIAVAQFDGPALPGPYSGCRPSAFLVDGLADVAERFHNLNSFETPYTVTPDTRWASITAQARVLLAGADMLIYGRYSLLRSGAKPTSAEPDMVLVEPRVQSAPVIPLPFTILPISRWQLKEMRIKLDDLCSERSDFVKQVQLVGLAAVGTELIKAAHYDAAGEALNGAKALLRDSPRDNNPCPHLAEQGETGAIAASYLAGLDNRLGHYRDAKIEYRCAAVGHISAAPFIDLGVLRIATGERRAGLQALDAAVHAEPNSVAALATRSLYERRNGDPDAAAIDLDRALQLPIANIYDLIDLADAVYERNSKDGCGLKLAEQALNRRDFDQNVLGDTLVNFSSWMKDSKEHRLALLTKVLQHAPLSAVANYRVGIEFAEPRDRDRRRAYLLRAKTAPAFTDDEFLEKGNAAKQMASDEQPADPAVARSDYAAAISSYDSATKINSGSSLTFWLRGIAELAYGDLEHARPHQRELLRAAAQRDFEAMYATDKGWAYQLDTYLDSGLLPCTRKTVSSCKAPRGASSDVRKQYEHFMEIYSRARNDLLTWRGTVDRRFNEATCRYEDLDVAKI